MNSNLRSLSRSFTSGIKSTESIVTTLSTDKNVLYIMLIIAVVNILGYLMMGNFEAVVFFAIVAYLSTFFTKNMVIVFLIAILATNFLMVSKVNYFKNAKEGFNYSFRQQMDGPDLVSKVNYFKNAKEGFNYSFPQQMDGPELPPSYEGFESKPNPSTKPSTKPTTKPTTNPSTKPTTNPSTKPSGTPTPVPTKKATTKTGGGKNKEGMNGKLAPAKFNDDPESDNEGDAAPFPSSKAQETKNVEKAHDNLQNIGGMGAQTEQVMQQQKILMDNMKTMQPFLETAERFLDKFNMKGIDGLLGKIGLGGGQNASPTTSA